MYHKTRFMSHKLFQSTLPVRGATPNIYQHSKFLQISIHAPREGSDLAIPKALLSTVDISIHAPREGSDRFVRPSLSITI